VSVAGLEGDNGRGYGGGARQHERALAGADGSGRPPEGRLYPAKRLPGDPAALLALHAEQLVSFDPLQQGSFYRVGVAVDHALRGYRAGAGYPLEEAYGSYLPDSSAFFQESLLEVSPGNSDFTPERDQLLRGETVSNVVLGGLELGCALNDSLECRPVDASG
jgi:hypothetical protein